MSSTFLEAFSVASQIDLLFTSYDPFDFAQDRFTICFSVCSVPSVALFIDYLRLTIDYLSAFSAFIRGSISSFDDDLHLLDNVVA